ncbi:MAG: DUF4349 domain-containing protein [Gracilibacteraceae bacterium]|jgi:hypothetical protein|nr:DUF4349 domain-containing protein [Gracilibacteraceae bacterium]
MDDKELNLWREDGDGERAARFFAGLEADETVRERVRAKTRDLTQKPAAPRPVWKKMPRLRYIIAAAVLVLVCAALINLTRAPLESAVSNAYGGMAAGGAAEAPMAMAQADIAYEDTAAYDKDAGEARYGAENVAGAAGGGAVSPEEAPRADKIIYTLDAQLRVDNVAEAMRSLEARARELGGYVSGSRQNNQDYWQYGSLNLRVPATEFAAFADSLATWGTVTDKYIYSNDITEQYMDADSRLKSWQAQEDRYLEFFSAAETVEEMIMIENALNEVRREKESLAGQLKYWDSKLTYSEVNLELTQQRTDVAVTDPWQPVSFSRTLEAAKNAVIKTVSMAWNGFNGVVVLLGYALPVLIILLIAALVLRAWLRTKKARRQAAIAAALHPETPAETERPDAGADS